MSASVFAITRAVLSIASCPSPLGDAGWTIMEVASAAVCTPRAVEAGRVWTVVSRLRRLAVLVSQAGSGSLSRSACRMPG